MMHILRSAIVSIFVLCTVSVVDAANITLAPSSGNYKVGSTISVNVFISNNQEPVNAVSANISFTRDTLSLTSVSKSGSIIDLWAEEPAYSNNVGTVSFEGGMYNPGFSSLQGKVLTLNFKVISVGTANIRLIDGSVLSNDGNATNVLGTLGSATYNITEDVVEPKPATDTPVTPAATNNLSPNIISSSYPDSNKWYSSRDASFKWSVPAGVTSISTLYSTSPTATPSKVYTPAISGKDFAVDADGISYMHVQFKNSNGWGPTSHFKFQIDSTPPTNLVAALVDGNITSNTDPEIRVTAEDSLSGLSHITFSIDGKESEPYQISDNNIYKLPKSSGGEHLLTVTVFDKAGNKISTTSGYSVKNLPTPLVIDYTRDLDSNDALRVSGTSNPGLYVEISMRDRAGKVFTQTVKVDEDGVWRLVWTGDLDSGVYEMQARAVDDNYSYSEYTPIKVIIIDSIWPTLGLIILTTLLIIISAIGTAWYYFVQYIRLKNKVREAIKENTKK